MYKCLKRFKKIYICKEEKEYICEKCGRVFNNIRGYKCHINKCTGPKERNPPFICPLCGYIIKNSREKHLNYCNGKGPRSKRITKGRINCSFDEYFGKERSLEIREKISKSLTGRNFVFLSEESKIEHSRKRSEEMKIDMQMDGNVNVGALQK